MKFAQSIAALLVVLPVFVQASPLDFRNGQFQPAKKGGAPKAPAFPAKGGQFQPPNKGGNNANQGGNAAGNQATAASSAAAAGATAAANNDDPQKSLTLLQSVIATGFQNDGQNQPTAGQVASLTSSNNFINFCATVPNLKITNGLQIKEGSCNPAPMGVIPSTNNMPSSKFVFPKNGQTIQANQDFTVQMAIKNLNTGHFTNPNENYFAAPQVLDGSGNIIGHSHIVIEKLNSLDQTTPTDPLQFAFFKGLNDQAVNGVLTATVTGGLPAGVYRIASINSSANHQPALVAIAQHGSLDDMAYFTVADNAAAAGGNNQAAGAAPAPGQGQVNVKGNNTGNKGGVQGGFAGKPNRN